MSKLGAASAGLMILLVAGCQEPVPDPAPPVDRTVSFANDIQPILNRRCIECHVEGGFALLFVDLLLTEGSSWAVLVNQASSQDASHTLIVPGDSESSLLYQKVSRDLPPVGYRMPFSFLPPPRPPLTAEEIGLIRDWIDQGAVEN